MVLFKVWKVQGSLCHYANDPLCSLACLSNHTQTTMLSPILHLEKHTVWQGVSVAKSQNKLKNPLFCVAF